LPVPNTRQHRHQSILEILREAGSVTVTDLGERMGVTDMTIRRDLEVLEESGALKRFHGGAKLAAGSSYEPPMAVREQTNVALKLAIAAGVAGLVADGDTLILDGGSTGIAIAEALMNHTITVCPLSLRVAWTLAKSTSVSLLLPAGSVRSGELSLSGAETNDYLRAHRFDHYIMTASGFSSADGFTEWNLEDAAVKRAALASSTNTITAIDSSKFDNTGFVKICGINAPNIIVVDDQLDAVRMASLRGLAQRVIEVAG